MDGRMSSGGSVRRVKSFSARPLLLFAHEKCQGKRATGSHAVFRVRAALQMVKFCPKLPAGSLDFVSFGDHGGRQYKKNPAQASSGVCLGTGNLFFLVLTLGGLERIDFGTRLHCGRTDVRGHIAVADLPFERRIGTG
jgi:hypothetical protein